MAVATELTQLQQQQQTTGSSFASAETRLIVLQETQQEQEQAFEDVNLKIETLRRELFSAKGEATHCRTRQDTAQKRLQAVVERLSQHSQEQTRLTGTVAENRKNRE
ncbi:MAG: hypothetical protein J0653_01985, partial [Deltaproteobacteria bacterium]|nr:hypothetical protein [Deltaproteobacteria bacterium]